jgi:hypothetical protein
MVVREKHPSARRTGMNEFLEEEDTMTPSFEEGFLTRRIFIAYRVSVSLRWDNLLN